MDVAVISAFLLTLAVVIWIYDDKGLRYGADSSKGALHAIGFLTVFLTPVGLATYLIYRSTHPPTSQASSRRVGKIVSAVIAVVALGGIAASLAVNDSGKAASSPATATQAAALPSVTLDTPTPTYPPQPVGGKIQTTDGGMFQLISWQQPIASDGHLGTPSSAPTGAFGGAEFYICAGPNSAWLINPVDFVAVMADGIQVNHTLFFNAPGKPLLELQEVHAGLCVRGWVVFDLPGRPVRIAYGNKDIAWSLP